MREMVIDVGDIEIPRYIEVFDTTMHTKEYFTTISEAAAYIQIQPSKIVDALCADVEVRLKGRYRVDIVTDEEEDEEPFYESKVDIIFKNYRTDEVVIVSSVKDAKLKTGIQENIISKRIEADDDELADNFIFRKAQVETVRPWPHIDLHALVLSKQRYFEELKQNAFCFHKRNETIDRLLKSVLHGQHIALQSDTSLTSDQRKQFLYLLDQGLAERYHFDIELLIKHVKQNVKYLKRELDHMLDRDEEYERERELEADREYDIER